MKFWTPFQDKTDATKQAALDLSAITTGNTRTLTVPDASGTFATLENAQNFTGAKSFTTGTVTLNTSTTVNGPIRYVAQATTTTTALSGSVPPSVTCDATAGPYNVTLPTNNTVVGTTYELTKIDQTQNIVTVVGAISGQTNVSLSHPGQTIRVASAGAAGTWRLLSNTAPLYTHFLPNVVVQQTAELSAIGAAKGFGTMTLPAGYWYAGRRVRVTTKGTYQTPLSPGSVIVRVKVGTVVLAQMTVAASILATSSNTRTLFGEAVITCANTTGTTARLVCDADMTFGAATGVTDVAFSTASSVEAGFITPTSGTTGATVTVDVASNAAALVDITEQWSNAQAGQGTTITAGRMSDST